MPYTSRYLFFPPVEFCRRFYERRSFMFTRESDRFECQDRAEWEETENEFKVLILLVVLCGISSSFFPLAYAHHQEDNYAMPRARSTRCKRLMLSICYEL